MRTILLIDDDEACRTPVAEILRLWGWQVVEAADGEQGIALALELRPQVILCDLLMPRGNGYRVCRAVRAQFDLRHTKIIVITGRDYATDRSNAEEAGADEYLVKPIDFGQLRLALTRLLPGDEASLVNRDPAPKLADGANGTWMRFWGVRGSIPSPGPSTAFFGGNTSCLEIRADGQLIILDAGSGIRPLGESLEAEFRDQRIEATLLITHTHWDHIQGFPFFAPAYSARNRLHILGYEGAVNGLAATLGGSSSRLGRAQTGFVRTYALGMLGGAVLVAGALLAVTAG